jgi:hypothetical protein
MAEALPFYLKYKKEISTFIPTNLLPDDPIKE